MAQGGPGDSGKLAVSIKKADKACGYEVMIDGHPVQNAVIGATYHLDLANGPYLVLSLAAYGGIDIETPASVAVDAPTHKALVAMGWTPPEGSKL